MVIVEAEAAADRVGQAQLGADLLEEPAAEAAAENLVHDGQRGTSGLWRSVPRPTISHVRLVHIFFVDEVDAGLRAAKDIVARGQRARPAAAPSKAARSLASIAAGSKSPLMPTISLPLSVRSCQASDRRA